MAIAEEIRLTYMENWSDALFDLSMATAEIELSQEDMLAIGSTSQSFRDAFALDGVLPLRNAVGTEIGRLLQEFPNGIFPRLGTCSFKRTSVDRFPLKSVQSILAEVTAVNDRVAAAMKNALQGGYKQSLFLREWRDIPPWSEFRVFIKSRKIVGISQYHHQSVFPQVEQRLNDIIGPLTRGIVALSEAIDLSDVVADLYLHEEGVGMLATLIEINPYAEITDSCLYHWGHGGDFDERLRFRNKGGQIMGASIRSMA